jgi:hypothetical protein
MPLQALVFWRCNSSLFEVIFFMILDVSHFLIQVPTGKRQYFMNTVSSCMEKLSSEGTGINLIILSLVLKNKQFKCIIIITVNKCKLSCICKS